MEGKKSEELEGVKDFMEKSNGNWKLKGVGGLQCSVCIETPLLKGSSGADLS